MWVGLLKLFSEKQKGKLTIHSPVYDAVETSSQNRLYHKGFSYIRDLIFNFSSLLSGISACIFDM